MIFGLVGTLLCIPKTAKPLPARALQGHRCFLCWDLAIDLLSALPYLQERVGVV